MSPSSSGVPGAGVWRCGEHSPATEHTRPVSTVVADKAASRPGTPAERPQDPGRRRRQVPPRLQSRRPRVAAWSTERRRRPGRSGHTHGPARPATPPWDSHPGTGSVRLRSHWPPSGNRLRPCPAAPLLPRPLPPPPACVQGPCAPDRTPRPPGAPLRQSRPLESPGTTSGKLTLAVRRAGRSLPRASCLCWDPALHFGRVRSKHLRPRSGLGPRGPGSARGPPALGLARPA